MSKYETYLDPESAVDLLNEAFAQFNATPLDLKSQRKFLKEHGKVLTNLVSTCYLESLTLSYTGNTSLQKYAIDPATNKLPKPVLIPGEFLAAGAAVDITVGLVAKPVTNGLNREYFFGEPITLPQKNNTLTMLSMPQMVQSSLPQGSLAIN